MLCPKCFTMWNDDTDFMVHLEAHGLDPWKCKQLAKDSKHTSRPVAHPPSDPCTCRMWGSRFECELRIYKAR